MSVRDGVRQVWRRPRFRRLTLIKLLSQSGDGLIQVGVASHTLLSPERQPDAWAIAGVLAVTMLPFSVLGPFVSVVIDRLDRRRTILTADAARTALSLLLAALVLFHARGPHHGQGGIGPLLVVALVVMSLERFQIATLMAGLPRTVEPDEYLAANSVLPLIGPLGVMVGAAVAAGIRLSVGRLASATTADALIFALAAVAFAASVTLCLSFARRSLGPDQAVAHRVGQTLRDLGAALGHLAGRRPAALAVVTVTAMRLVFGFVSVGVILIYRNHLHAAAQVDTAVGDLALWVLATGAGFVLASAVNPFLVRRLGLRATVVAVLAAAAVNQALPGSVFTRPALVVAGCLLGLWAQCLKINADTLVQAHVDDAFKGRVLVIYDFAFNTPLVLAGLLAALVLPADGASKAAFLSCAGVYLLLSLGFAWRSETIGRGNFTKGTESVTGRPSDRPDRPADQSPPDQPESPSQPDS
ncbi:MAG: MFS transporter [Propionibacteriaceae bacterium]|nr:MFS transporter [Propionibacteriaceae bacterium]